MINEQQYCDNIKCQSKKAKDQYDWWFRLHKNDASSLQQLGNSLSLLDICQYHYSLHVMNSVDILLAPYNYVVTENIQKAIKLKIKNKILIFDEGHNIENFLEDSSSLCLSKTSLLTVIGDKKL